MALACLLRRRLWPALALSCLAVLAPVQLEPAMAEHDDVYQFLHSQARLQPSWAPAVVAPRFSRPRPPRIHEANLSDGKPRKPPSKKDEDPIAGLMKDPTLRRGDIVVFRSGAKVFNGGGQLPHRPSDFDDIRYSKLVPDKTRQAVMAMTRMAPAGPRLYAAKPVTGQAATRPISDDDPRVASTGSLPRRVGP